MFQFVVVQAVSAEVGLAGGAAVGPGQDVIEFGVGGFAPAQGEAAVLVAGTDVIARAVGGR
jgi:hypothetical protein